MKNVLARYRDVERLEVSFDQTKHLKDMRLRLESSGRMTLELPERVTWKILKPREVTVRLDQEKISIENGAAGAEGREEFRAADSPSAKDRRNYEILLNWLKLGRRRDHAFIQRRSRGRTPLPFHG
ncbi:MAG: hypothetical protein HC902_11715 [Calothrix sp. SM1_5_4]|nr:hypothetical protein [Calothrix sp. SM1_5_4]